MKINRKKDMKRVLETGWRIAERLRGRKWSQEDWELCEILDSLIDLMDGFIIDMTAREVIKFLSDIRYAAIKEHNGSRARYNGIRNLKRYNKYLDRQAVLFDEIHKFKDGVYVFNS